ncbi:hypothetical protein I302_104345 [Kwoniella bestiolae CBS 10118]|uniref:DUF6534 domain-containing protein n=1 Tax=Kwoniella bestiolae CBS 10118 TaxID=1296100 RepID=A0A1B9GB10_9TREE|nr:hypothetical protein I302_03052 [Kwoniella bestiolae CBS 10118]OCF28200.1 hypothetical protein I302_03052 [Kwoniella bestiolae CBS 10118]
MKLFRALSYHQRSASRTEVLYWSGSIILITLAVACFGAGLADPIYLGISLADMSARENFIYGTDDSFRVYTIIIETQFTSILILDVILSVLFSLKLQRSRTGFASSNRVIDVLLFILLRNGFLATALQLTTVVLSRNPDKNMWTMIPGGIISKVYVLTVLAILTKPRDGQNRSSVHSKRTGRPTNGPGNLSARGLCQSCRSRSRAEPSMRVENETGSFGFLEFLQSSGSDDLDHLQKKERYSPSQLEEGQSHGYLDIEVDPEFEHNRGTKEIIIEVERQEESFVSPPDRSPQALRNPRQYVLGIRSSEDRNESQEHVELV